MTTEAGSRLGELVAQAREAASVLSDDDKDLRPIAFELVLDHLLGNGGAQAEGAPRATPSAGPTAEPVDSSLATEQQRTDAVARYFQIEPEQVPELFDMSGEEPLFVLHSSKLPKQTASAVRDLALLIAGARTAVGLETSTGDLRQTADAYGTLDSNFMTTLSNLNNIAVLGKPSSPNRLVRMKVTGAEAARPLAQRLVS